MTYNTILFVIIVYIKEHVHSRTCKRGCLIFITGYCLLLVSYFCFIYKHVPSWTPGRFKITLHMKESIMRIGHYDCNGKKES